MVRIMYMYIYTGELRGTCFAYEFISLSFISCPRCHMARLMRPVPISYVPPVREGGRMRVRRVEREREREREKRRGQNGGRKRKECEGVQSKREREK